MKKLVLVVLFVLSVIVAFAAPIEFIKADGSRGTVAPATPLPVTMGSISTSAAVLPIGIYERPTGYAVYTVPAVGSVSIVIPAGTTYLNSIATVPYCMSLNTTTLITGTAPTIGGVTSVGSTTIVQYHGYLGATSTVTVNAYGPGF